VGARLGLNPLNLQNTPRLLVLMGLLDPVTVSRPDSWNPGQSRDHSRTLFIGQLAHTADLLAPQYKDRFRGFDTGEEIL
jgi:hypothetical protein